jgi:hypothetical protein
MIDRVKRIETEPPTLEQKISASLNDTNCQSSTLADLLVACDGAIIEAEQAADRAKADALDPAVCPDVREARDRLENAAFAANRLRTLRPRIEQRLSVVSAQEQVDAFRDKYANLKVQRDQLAAEFKAAYQFVPQLADVLKKIAVFNVDRDRLHRQRPDSVSLYLHGPEAVARGTTDFDDRSIVSRLVLPDFDSDELLWPPPSPSIDPAFVTPGIERDIRTTGDWWRPGAEAFRRKQQEDEKALADAEQQKINFYRGR